MTNTEIFLTIAFIIIEILNFVNNRMKNQVIESYKKTVALQDEIIATLESIKNHN